VERLLEKEYSTIDAQFKEKFLCGPPQNYTPGTETEKQSVPVMEAGSNTSIVAQRVFGGDEKRTQCLRV
jgi:hypothetical protein